ncbi:threonine/homoserine efflux transporter RhtA [Stackebrandtia albiflava]|uniref:Threonine/homoserine efflux transporter RhtA n=1 Tax=Stackebrandtia albiflava TaxID=406432 RepID=A0A562V1X2_9ACTN|nr:DMT family transporter [Stackebrandtia albiflava]TWJ11878.1 threonine/homoserine efflux transporter RhtA [Stackebrandtia albiflava]
MSESPSAGTPRSSTLLPFLALCFTVVMWASAFVAIRYVGAEFTAGPLSLGRLAVAAVLLGGMVLWQSRRAPATDTAARALPRGRAWGWLLLCGVSWFGVYNVALNEAERRIDAGTASMLVNIGPILIALLAGWLLAEGFPRALLLGGGVAFIGVVVIGVGGAPGGATDPLGVVLALVAAVCYAIGVVSQKRLLGTVSGLRVTFLACVVGMVACLPFLPALWSELAAASPAAVWWLVYLGVGPTALAFSTWAYALARTSAGRTGATTYLVPPVVVLLAWLLLGEVPAWTAVAGGVVCLAGVALTRRRARVPGPVTATR